MCLADARLFMAGLNLAYTDRASMAASVEVRVPFVDPVVAAGRVHDRRAGQDPRPGQGKAALKDAAENWLPRRDRVPAEGLLRRAAARLGPQRPARADQRRARRRRARPARACSAGEPLLRLIADERAGREDYAKQIWQLLSMELWYRQVRAAGVAS